MKENLPFAAENILHDLLSFFYCNSFRILHIETTQLARIISLHIHELLICKTGSFTIDSETSQL